MPANTPRALVQIRPQAGSLRIAQRVGTANVGWGSPQLFCVQAGSPKSWGEPQPTFIPNWQSLLFRFEIIINN